MILKSTEAIIEKIYDEFFEYEQAWMKNTFALIEMFFQYSPTSYSAIEELFKNYLFEVKNHIIDFGCGKGRVLIIHVSILQVMK